MQHLTCVSLGYLRKPKYLERPGSELNPEASCCEAKVLATALKILVFDFSNIHVYLVKKENGQFKTSCNVHFHKTTHLCHMLREVGGVYVENKSSGFNSTNSL